MLEGKIVRARNLSERGRSSDVAESAYLAAVDALRERDMPFERQSAEWGVRAIKGPFQRPTVPLPTNVRARYWMPVCCANLLIFRSRYVGLSQLRIVYVTGSTTAHPWV